MGDFFTEELPHYFSAEQLAELANGGIGYEDIEAAYRHLAMLPSVPFPQNGSVVEQMEAVKQVVNNSVGLSSKFSNLMPTNCPALPNLLPGASPADGTIKSRGKDAHARLKCYEIPGRSSVKITPQPTQSRSVVVLGDGLMPETIVSCR